MRVISLYLAMPRMMLEDVKGTQDAYAELEWIALHYEEEATDEQRARLDAFLAAVDAREDDA